MHDTQFLAHFEAAKLHPFTHQDHIRMAWLYLRRDGWDQGYQQIQVGLKHFAASHGAAHKYHETITRFWTSLVQHCIDEHPDIDNFERFIAVFPILFNKTALSQHYSDDLLWSDVARNTWQVPDLIAMPTR